MTPTSDEQSARKLDELIRDVVDIRVTLGRLDARSQAAETAERAREDRAHRDDTTRTAHHQDHEDRLRALEKARWLLVGAGVAGGSAAGAVLKLLGG